MNTQEIAEFRKVAAWVEDLRKDLNKGTIPHITNFRKVGSWADLIKVATPDSDFEQSFFQLAYEKLQDKLHNILPYMVGFEIVNKSDDGTKALGVFGFKSNNQQVIYIPAFFVNGTVKGIDIMYSKNNEQFYPLNEDFAELFLKDDSTGVGDASSESAKQINQSAQPMDMRDLVRPPRTGKVSYASVMDFVEEGGEMVKKAFEKLFTENDVFMESILRFYPVEKIAKAIAPKPSKPAFSQPLVSILTNKDTSAPNEFKQKIAMHGYAILDKRAEDKKSKFGLVKYPELFTNPTDSGFYSYLSRAGKIEYGLIITKLLKLNPHFATDEALVMDLVSGKTYRRPIKEIWVRNKYVIKDYSEVHSKMIELAEAEPSFDDHYILINDKMIATQPFRIRANAKDDGVRKVNLQNLFAMTEKSRSYRDFSSQTEFKEYNDSTLCLKNT